MARITSPSIFVGNDALRGRTASAGSLTLYGFLISVSVKIQACLYDFVRIAGGNIERREEKRKILEKRKKRLDGRKIHGRVWAWKLSDRDAQVRDSSRE